MMTPQKSDPQANFLRTLEQARAGDSEAMEALFTGYYPRVSKMVHEGLARDLRTKRPWLATRFSTGDVVQEVFRSLLKDLSGFRGTSEDAFRGYLAMVVRNRLLDAIRFHESAQRDGRITSRSPEGLDPAGPSPDPVAEAENAEEAKDLHETLQTFPEHEQLLLRARLEQGVKFQDLADQLGYPSKAAARRAFYSAQALLVIRLGQLRSE